MIRQFLGKVRRQEPGIYALLYRAAKATKTARVPAIRPLGALLFHGRDAWLSLWTLIKGRLISEQMLRYRCDVHGRVQIDGTLPLIYGDGSITIGDGVRIGNRGSWIVGLKVYDDARLEIGEGSTLGYMNVISVAQSVRIGRHCLFAGEVKIFDNNSHPLNFERRRENAPLQRADVAPVVIEDDVWIGTSCFVLKGVTIGRGAIIGAGAVVTRSVPSFTVAAGNPARVIKHLEPHFTGQLEAQGLLERDDVHADNR